MTTVVSTLPWVKLTFDQLGRTRVRSEASCMREAMLISTKFGCRNSLHNYIVREQLRWISSWTTTHHLQTTFAERSIAAQQTTVRYDYQNHRRNTLRRINTRCTSLHYAYNLERFTVEGMFCYPVMISIILVEVAVFRSRVNYSSTNTWLNSVLVITTRTAVRYAHKQRRRSTPRRHVIY